MEILKCQHTLWRDGRNAGFFNTDIVFIDGLPYLVFAWQGNRPTLTVPLDPERLHPMNWPDVQYLYELPVNYPGPPTH